MRVLLGLMSIWYFPLRCFILLIGGLAIYAKTFGFDFVFDDHEFIILNSSIKNFQNIHHAWEALPKTRLIGIYSFACNYYFSQLNTYSYHVFNFLVHLITVGLVWFTTRVLFKIAGWFPTKNPVVQELPFLVALLFLVHPGQTQAVTYISQRFESMATLFYLSSIYCYLHARISLSTLQKTFLLISSGVFALLGILTKETAITIPLTILAIEYIFWNKDFLKNFLSKKISWSIFLCLGIIFFLLFMKLVRVDLNIFFHFPPTLSESHDGDTITAGKYLLTQLRVFLTFLRLLICPIHQNIDYDYPLSTGLFSPPLTFIGLLLIGFISFLIIKLRKNFPLIAFGLAWILITFSINLAPRKNIIFEHKLYLISFGFFLFLVTSLFILIRHRISFIILFACLIGLLSFTSFKRNDVWRNPLTLWEDTAQKSPHKERVLSNLGNAYNIFHRYQQAIITLNKAIALNPLDYKNYLCRAESYDGLENEKQALEDLNKAIELSPKYYAPYVIRSQFYTKHRNYEAALSDLNQTIIYQPDFEDAYIERSILLMEKGEIKEALTDLNKALRIAPYNFRALVNRSGIYYSIEQYELALKDLDLARKINPPDIRIYKNKIFCFIKLKETKKAMSEIQNILKISHENIKLQDLQNEILHLK